MKHGSLRAYNSGCRCDACRGRNAEYRRQRRANPDISAGQRPGPVELAVIQEIGLAAEERPAVAAAAVALGRLLDNPRAIGQHPSAARVLSSLLNQLHKVGAPRRRSHLAMVKQMTDRNGA